MSARVMSNQARLNLVGWAFVSFAVIGVFLFKLGPMLVSFWWSFNEFDVITSPRFVGFQNYIELFTEDNLFWKSIVNTFYYVGISLPLRLVGALFFAILLNQKLRGMAFYRTLYYLPSVTAGVAVSLVWTWVFEPTFGVLNNILKMFGIQGPAWLGSPEWAMPAVIISGVWQLGQQMLIFLAGLQSVSPQLYEAADLDGASAWQKARLITVPMISPIIFFNLVVGIIQSLQVFEKIYVMTQGGPLNATMVIVMYLYRKAFTFLEMGYGSAIAWILFIVIFALTLLQFRLSKWVHYEN